jgi:uncharacterized SAM-binding protein YcdF (DUF218 family)
LKQFLKQLVLPPVLWMLPLLAVLIFWRRRWARKLLLLTVCGIFILHSGLVAYWLRYPLEARYPPLLKPRDAGPYDVIVVLTSASIPAGGLLAFPTIDEAMFRRLDEAWRLYRLNPKPIIVSGGHVNPFTPDRGENKIACEYLLRWGVAPHHVIGEAKSRDTFESAVETSKLLRQRSWKRYLLVTSAVHMPRSMLAFSRLAPEPIPAPGDFTLDALRFSPLDFAPSESAARTIASTLHEYVGLINYYWRIRASGLSRLQALASAPAILEMAGGLRQVVERLPQQRK